jgi:hypothetical protein
MIQPCSDFQVSLATGYGTPGLVGPMEVFVYRQLRRLAEETKNRRAGESSAQLSEISPAASSPILLKL